MRNGENLKCPMKGLHEDAHENSQSKINERRLPIKKERGIGLLTMEINVASQLRFVNLTRAATSYDRIPCFPGIDSNLLRKEVKISKIELNQMPGG